MGKQIKTTNYFSHDSNARNDEKVIRLRMKHGAAGYGTYFMILERLREERNYMSAKDYNMIAFDLRVDASLVKSVVEDFGLFAFVSDGECFYSESFNNRMEAKDELSQRRSQAGKKGNEKRWAKKSKGDDADAEPTPSPVLDERPQAPVKPAEPADNDKCYKRFFAEENKSNLEVLLMNFGMKPNGLPVLKKTAKEIVAEWQMADKLHQDYTDWSQHLIATMRIKLKDKKQPSQTDAEPPTTADYQYDGGFGSKDV